MTEEQTAKGIGEQFRQALAATWKPRLHDLKGWGKAFLLTVIPVIALDFCVAMPFLALTIAVAVSIPMALDRGQTLKTSWSETKTLYRESFDFVKNHLNDLFHPSRQKPELPLAAHATEVSSFQNGSSRLAFNQGTKAAATVEMPAPERPASDRCGPKV